MGSLFMSPKMNPGSAELLGDLVRDHIQQAQAGSQQAVGDDIGQAAHNDITNLMVFIA